LEHLQHHRALSYPQWLVTSLPRAAGEECSSRDAQNGPHWRSENTANQTYSIGTKWVQYDP